MFRDTYAPEVSPIGAAILHQIGENNNSFDIDNGLNLGLNLRDDLGITRDAMKNEIKQMIVKNLLVQHRPGSIIDVGISPMYRMTLCSAIRDYVTNHYKDGIDINTLTQILAVEGTSIHEKCLYNAIKAMESRNMIEVDEEGGRITYIRKAN